MFEGDRAAVPSHLRSPDLETEERELVPVGVRITAATAEVTEQERERHPIRELPKLNFIIRDQALAFLQAELPWGETGLALFQRIKELGQSPTIHIKYTTEDALRKSYPGDGALPKVEDSDMLQALEQATRAGLLIGGISKGYRFYRLTPSEPTSVYRVNESREVPSLLEQATKVSTLNKEKIDAIFDNKQFIPSDLPFRNDLTPIEFYSFFTAPRTQSDAMKNGDFFPNGRVQFTPEIRTFIEGHLRYSTQHGFLDQATRSDGAPVYTLSEAGRKYIQDRLKEQNRP